MHFEGSWKLLVPLKNLVLLLLAQLPLIRGGINYENNK
jgi:hypothetical protein